MKKRILLLLIFGVGFTPALFAKEPVRAGEMLVSKTNPSGIGCNLPLDKHLGTMNVGSSSENVGSVSAKAAK